MFMIVRMMENNISVQWMHCLGFHGKRLLVLAIENPFMEICFFNNQSAVDQFVVENSEQSTSMPNVSEKDHGLAQLAG